MTKFLGFFISILTIFSVLFSVHLWRLPRGRLMIDFLNVGQGDAILITTPDQNHILIDGGPDQSLLTQLGEVLPFLQKNIDFMVLTHPHADHIFGLVEILKRYQVKAILFSGVNYSNPIYDEFLRIIQSQNIPLYVARANEDWQLGAINLDIVYPLKSLLGISMENINNASVVIRLGYKGNHVLFTGDAESQVENEILKVGFNLQAEVLKAGHHGSKTASGEDFLDKVKPSLAIIQCGKDNSFGHPHTETLNKLTKRDVSIKSNDQNGRIRITISSLQKKNHVIKKQSSNIMFKGRGEVVSQRSPKPLSRL
ncbi:MAG: metallo-beta-lactamase superfamily hydrolase-like protein [Candidatus Peregrinibacteria bacterium GW2011_GWE2_39_6]|nr:MAG: metallo-beta-lactamase superfamily hydrolase-like protein [Candidatus Peregrinibacteria bacterium GW2011_GWE2_39_6]